MQDLQEIHKTLEAKRKEMRELNRMLRDELANSKEYQDVVEEVKTLRDKKKSIENQIRSTSFDSADKIDVLKLEIKHHLELLSDVALNLYAQKQNIEITDENNVRWLPTFVVKFKKEDGEPEKAPKKEAAPSAAPIIEFNEAAA